MKKFILLFLFIIPFAGYPQDLNEELRIAAGEGKTDEVKILIESGADVNVSGYDGVTLLMVAAEPGNTKVVETLLDAGAYLFWKDEKGKTALDYAIKGGHSKTISLIQTRLNDDPVMREKGWNRSYPDEITTPEFKVLDINWNQGLVAFRHVYRIEEKGYPDYVNGEEVFVISDSVAECNYAGMNIYPTGSGIIIVVYDLNKDEHMRVFTICESVSKKSDCMTHEESKKVLDEAKAFFLSLDLDIYHNPEFLDLNGELVLTPENFMLKECCYRKFDRIGGEMFSMN